MLLRQPVAHAVSNNRLGKLNVIGVEPGILRLAAHDKHRYTGSPERDIRHLISLDKRSNSLPVQ